MITATMPRSLHIYGSGFQCAGESVDPSEFCEDHQKVVAFERLQDSFLRKAFLRIVAFILLLITLLPLYYTLRDLYRRPPVKVQGVW